MNSHLMQQLNQPLVCKLKISVSKTSDFKEFINLYI